ncbi:MAG: hypothetical protein AAGK37_15475 [Pseudomonadota bacterium]
MYSGLYAGDSLFTLTPLQVAGVVALAALLAALALSASWRMMRGRRWPVRLALAALAFWLFEWLAPQVFYTYYRVIIPSLPAQWVIGWLPGPAALGELLTFQGQTSLSAHSRGVLGWLLVASALWPRRDAAN